MAKKLIVIRKLKSTPDHEYEPEVLCVIEESTDPDVTDQYEYMRDIAKDKIDKFRNKFPEFKNANFYFRYIDSENIF